MYVSCRWVESEATKDGADADIAKYDGDWAIESPTVGGFSEDKGLVMKVKPKASYISLLSLVVHFRLLRNIMQHLQCLKSLLHLIKIIWCFSKFYFESQNVFTCSPFKV